MKIKNKKMLNSAWELVGGVIMLASLSIGFFLLVQELSQNAGFALGSVSVALLWFLFGERKRHGIH